MQKVLELTNKYIVLATPLIIYSLISSIYLIISAGGGRIINYLFAIVLFLLMTSAFAAGWFNMIKIAVLNPEKEDANSLIKEFTSGVGEYFLPSIGAILLILFLSIITIIFSYKLGMHYIGNINISAETLSDAMKNTTALKAFMLSLSEDQLIKINLWNILILTSLSFTCFLSLLYLPALFFKNKNPFIAFYISLKDLFSKRIFKTFGIFLLIFTINFCISILSAILGNQMIMHFILTLINFYFITAVGVGVFYYYYQNFVKNYIGQNVDIEI